MNLFQHVCKISDTVTNPNNLIEIVTLLFIGVLVFIIFKIYKETKKWKHTIAIISGVCIGMFLLWIATLLGMWLAFGLDDNPPSSAYHPLNAMIKYRCYQDHRYCPITENDVRTIAPDYLKQDLQNANITYNFDQKTQNYTLIIRNTNYHFNNDRVVIFDPRLATIKGYGYGFDFFDADIVDNCNGTFTVTNPPPFSGPWDMIK